MADVERLSKRPAEYLWETGVAPLSAGSFFFLVGASDLLKPILPKTDLAQEGIKWLAMCLGAAIIWGVQSIKNRFVYPRSGYVVPAPPNLWLLVPAFLVPLVFFDAFSLYRHMPDHDFIDSRLMAPGFAVLCGTLALYQGRMRKMPLLYGIYLICLALLIWWLPLNTGEQYGLLQSGACGPLAVLGAIRLRAFLKANPRPVDSTNGG